MRQVILIIAYCLLAGFLSPASAQLPTLAHQFTTEDGLSDNSVTCALRDSYGLLWIGTENGLNCYDGLRIHAYRDIVASENPNETNTVSSLYEHEGNIWFGGSAGLYVFNRYENTYSRFMLRTRYGVMISSAVPKIVGGPDQRLIWITTMGQGIFIYNTETHQLAQDSRHGNFFCDITIGTDGLVYAVTLSGQLVVFRGDGQYLRSYDVGGYQFQKNPISIVQTDHDLWLAYNTRLLRLNQDHRSTEVEAEAPAMGAIHALTADKNGRLYLGTDDGVYRYTTDDGHLQRIANTQHPSPITQQLSDNMVNALMWDADSTLLVLTHTGGLNSIVVKQQGFTFVPLPDESSYQGTNTVRALCRASEGELWIGTDHGLYLGNYERRQITRCQPDRLNFEIKALMLDGDDLWIGTRHDGIRILNVKTGDIRAHVYSETKPYTILSNEVNRIFRTRGGEIYVLTSWGLSRYARSTDNFHSYASISAMTPFICMEEAANGWLWASSNTRGLYCKKANDQMFNPFSSKTIGRQTITVMHGDRQGNLWAASNGGGLYRFEPTTADFKRYDTEGTLLYNQVVRFIEEDDQGALWLGTSVGIIRMGPSRNIADLQVCNYSHNNFFLQQSSSAHGYDNVVFGTRGGVWRLSTHQLSPIAQQQPVYIQNLSLPYAADSRAELQRLGLDVLLYTREEIKLPHTDNSFTLHFASARYSGMPPTKYEYMLEGFDRTWAHETTTPQATYANLPPGDYLFRLRQVGQTDKSLEARLRITVLPPWYRTNLAYFLYILLALAAILYTYYRTQRRLKRRYEQQMRQFQQEQEKETFQSKIRFFIDLVHEIRTPLTLMSLPLEQMEQNRHTTAMRRNMNYLLGITNQLLDFQKQENGGITLLRRKTDVAQMLRQIYDQFSDATEVQNKHLQLQLPDEPIVVLMDKDKMMKAMMNLVGNAMKYAASEIIIRLENLDGKHVAITVLDDGPGVPAEEKDKIFDRYYQIGNDSTAASIGTGLGLAYTKMLAQAHEGNLEYQDAPGGGSSFRLTIPLRPEHLTKDDQDHLDSLKSDEAALYPTNPLGSDEVALNEAASNFRILLVEDNEELLKATADALRKWYKVVKAHDGIEALDMLKYQEIDMVVSDVMMPRMDGNQLCRQIKSNIETSHLPVIMLTAKVSVQAKTEGMESGADIYIEKPFSIKQLHLQIENILRLRQQFYQRMRSIDGFNATAADTTDKPLGLNQQDLQFIEALQKSVQENMRDEEFSIDTLAEQLNLSRSSFYRKIKALTGMTPTDYLKNARMNEAARLLTSGLRSSEVAECIGFTSSSYFAKCFRAQFGCLPKDYTPREARSEGSA